MQYPVESFRFFPRITSSVRIYGGRLSPEPPLSAVTMMINDFDDDDNKLHKMAVS